MSFQNLYYKRTTGTAKACYVCFKPTTTVLATINTTDFLYTCPGHLNDSNFASKVKDESTKSQVTAEEIEKVKREWEEKERKKKEKEEAAAKEKKEEDDKAKEGSPNSKTTPPAAPVPVPAPAPAPTPSHERDSVEQRSATNGTPATTTGSAGTEAWAAAARSAKGSS